jgi:hypothetical protein
MAAPYNPLNLYGYLATSHARSKAKNTVIFNYFEMLHRLQVFANPSIVEGKRFVDEKQNPPTSTAQSGAAG